MLRIPRPSYGSGQRRTDFEENSTNYSQKSEMAINSGYHHIWHLQNIAILWPQSNYYLFTSITVWEMTEMSDFKELNKKFTGKRIRLFQMKDDPNPVPDGTEGTILHVADIGTIHVKWDNGRNLGVIIGVDRYLIF